MQMNESIENKLHIEHRSKKFCIKFEQTILSGNQLLLMAYMRVSKKKMMKRFFLANH